MHKVAAGCRSFARVVMLRTSMAHNEKRKLRSKSGEEMQLMKDGEDEELEDK